MAEYLAILFDGTQTVRREAETFKDAEAICQQHLGYLTDDMKGGSAYSDGLEGEGWTEEAAWFSDEDGYGPSAAIYSRETE